MSETPKVQRPFLLKTDIGKVIEWTGADAEDAAVRAADCLRVTIVATKPADRHGLFVLGGGTIEG